MEIANNSQGGASSENLHVILPYAKQGEYFIESVTVEKKPLYSFIKRAFDIAASAIALVVLFIPMLIIAAAIKCTSEGTVFYRQERLGLNGKKISVIKFRSMRMDAEHDGARWSIAEDERVTPIGAVLRRTELDELPQLWCILKGDLSFVGPRPERECFHREFETYIHGFGERLKVKPGLTGLAQVSGGYHMKPEEKIQYDIEYIKNRSLWLDLKIIIRTARVVFAQNREEYKKK